MQPGNWIFLSEALNGRHRISRDGCPCGSPYCADVCYVERADMLDWHIHGLTDAEISQSCRRLRSIIRKTSQHQLQIPTLEDSLPF
jgi:hypothetical protein